MIANVGSITAIRKAFFSVITNSTVHFILFLCFFIFLTKIYRMRLYTFTKLKIRHLKHNN